MFRVAVLFSFSAYPFVVLHEMCLIVFTEHENGLLDFAGLLKNASLFDRLFAQLFGVSAIAYWLCECETAPRSLLVWTTDLSLLAFAVDGVFRFVWRNMFPGCISFTRTNNCTHTQTLTKARICDVETVRPNRLCHPNARELCLVIRRDGEDDDDDRSRSRLTDDWIKPIPEVGCVVLCTKIPISNRSRTAQRENEEVRATMRTCPTHSVCDTWLNQTTRQRPEVGFLAATIAVCCKDCTRVHVLRLANAWPEPKHTQTPTHIHMRMRLCAHWNMCTYGLAVLERAAVCRRKVRSVGFVHRHEECVSAYAWCEQRWATRFKTLYAEPNMLSAASPNRSKWWALRFRRIVNIAQLFTGVISSSIWYTIMWKFIYVIVTILGFSCIVRSYNWTGELYVYHKKNGVPSEFLVRQYVFYN